MAKHWTTTQILQLRAWYPTGDVEKLSKIFGKSTWAIKTKASRLGIEKAFVYKPDDKIELPLENLMNWIVKGYSYNQIHEMTNISHTTLRRRVDRLPAWCKQRINEAGERERKAGISKNNGRKKHV